MLEVLGLVLLVQGVGGVINNLFSGSKSWFVVNYLGLPTPLPLIGHALLLAAGMALLARRGGLAWLKDLAR